MQSLSVADILRFLHLSSLVIWIGMMVFFTFFAAPSIFKVLPRETAGEVVGHIFPKYWAIGYATSIVAVATLIALAYMEKAFPVARVAILAAMLVVMFYSGLVVGSKAREIKAEMKRVEEPARKQALRGEFRSVHIKSSILNLVVIVLGVVVIFLTSVTLRI